MRAAVGSVVWPGVLVRRIVGNPCRRGKPNRKRDRLDRAGCDFRATTRSTSRPSSFEQSLHCRSFARSFAAHLPYIRSNDMADPKEPRKGANPAAAPGADAQGWSGRFAEPVSPLVKRYTASVD